MQWLSGKVALVTGGARGIGRAVVERFIAEGAQVCAMDLQGEDLAALPSHGDQLVTVVGDVRVYADNERAVRHCLEAFTKLDIFVANAGIFDGFSRLDTISPTTLEEVYQQIFDVNVKGTLFGVKAALEPLKNSRGSVIATLSQASFYPDGGGVVYTASKHAGLGLVRQLAFECAPLVRVNGVAPGGTITQLTVPQPLANLVKPMGTEEKRKRIQSRNPLQIAQDPEDHAAAYVYLASNQSRAVTGEVIRSDGGLGVRGL